MGLGCAAVIPGDLVLAHELLKVAPRPVDPLGLLALQVLQRHRDGGADPGTGADEVVGEVRSRRHPGDMGGKLLGHEGCRFKLRGKAPGMLDRH
jgi:hypothetical protein